MSTTHHDPSRRTTAEDVVAAVAITDSKTRQDTLPGILVQVAVDESLYGSLISRTNRSPRLRREVVAILDNQLRITSLEPIRPDLLNLRLQVDPSPDAMQFAFETVFGRLRGITKDQRRRLVATLEQCNGRGAKLFGPSEWVATNLGKVFDIAGRTGTSTRRQLAIHIVDEVPEATIRRHISKHIDNDAFFTTMQTSAYAQWFIRVLEVIRRTKPDLAAEYVRRLPKDEAA
ncbi:MAG: hypothetical protein IT290_12275 [Deltaproteobacteria bacterium]|nr:hypothetical protein [Deltaproteobacteria bacterium]